MSKHITRNNSRNPLMISWDNPVPANSKRMIRQLKKHGRVRKSEPKIDRGAHAARPHRLAQDLSRAIVRNLHPSRGNAMYANLNSGRAFEYGRSTNYTWRRVS